MDPTLLVAVVGVIGVVLGAAVSSWLGARQSIAHEIREMRMTAYPGVWRRTSVLSRWPRTDASIENLNALRGDLRQWYYGVGGMAMSANARKRYEELQTLIEAILVDDLVRREPPANVSASRLPPELYEAVMNSASAFRTALTEDIQSRNQRSLIVAASQWQEHRRTEKAAEARLHGLGERKRTDVPSPGADGRPALPPHHITAVDERLVDSAAMGANDPNPA